MKPDGSLCLVLVPSRVLLAVGCAGIAESAEQLAGKLRFAHFAVPSAVVRPGLHLSQVPGVGVMILQLRSLPQAFMLSIRPSPSLPQIPENPVATKLLQNQQLRVYGTALFQRYSYSPQGSKHTYAPMGIGEIHAFVEAVPGIAAMLQKAQGEAAKRRADQVFEDEFRSRSLSSLLADSAAVGGGQSYSVRSFGQSSSASQPKASTSAGDDGRAGGGATNARRGISAQATPTGNCNTGGTQTASNQTVTEAKARALAESTIRARDNITAQPRATSSLAAQVASGPVRPSVSPAAAPPPKKASFPSLPSAKALAQTLPPAKASPFRPSGKASSPVPRLPDPCPICDNTYQITHHMKRKAGCCSKRVCSTCGDEMLKIHLSRWGSFHGAPCPFCRHKPLDLQVAGDSDCDGGESMVIERAQQARVQEDAQLAQILQDIEAEGVSPWAGRVARGSHARQAEVAQLRAQLSSSHSRGVSTRAASSAAAHNSPGASSSSHTDRTFKTTLCIYYQRGHCARGASCGFAHSSQELRIRSFTIREGTALDPPQTFMPQSRVPQPANYKTSVCEFYEGGACKFGAHCTFAHGSGELQAAPQRPSSVVQNWLAARSICAAAGLGGGGAEAASMEGQSEIAVWRRRLVEAKAARRPFAFPPQLTAADRKVIHMICDELSIEHESRGEGAQRCIHIFFEDDDASLHYDHEDMAPSSHGYQSHDDYDCDFDDQRSHGSYQSS
ncbi:unnamed protein product [Polarella glacialis]|uniref:RING-type E3 ubiquitin transferase n=1 Tax=Polarella glacialis TaxID=89957 RepID=A0A813GTI5_POLGL|nr:unnamed protein product [Polarella glacialis]